MYTNFEQGEAIMAETVAKAAMSTGTRLLSVVS